MKLLNFEKCPKEMENKLKDIGQKYDVLYIFYFFKFPTQSFLSEITIEGIKNINGLIYLLFNILGLALYMFYIWY